jgi:hypothetical protein
MSLDIKELYKSDLDPNYISTWWSTKKVEKLNWNFDRIEESGGGPLGPQGWLGKSGPIGANGAQGTNGRQGPLGNRGNQGFSGENDWIENYTTGDTNAAILIKQIKDDPYDVKVGYSNMHAAYSSATTHTSSTGSINRWNTRDSSTIWNGVFTSSDIDGSNTDISTRKVYFWNLYNPLNLSAEFESGFRNTTGGRTKFFSNKFIFQTPEYTNNGFGVFSLTTGSNLKKYLELDVTKFLLGPDVVSEFGYTATFKATTDSGTPINHKFGPTIYSIPGPRKIAFTNSGAMDVGTVLWGNAYDVIGGFPVGSIIITQNEFIEDFFHLEESGTVVNKGAVSGFDNPSITPVIEFKYGAGKLGTKFEGWYLCNGKTWSKGTVSYELPNLCGFDLNVDYDVFGDLMQAEIVANGNINQSTPNKQIQGSAVIKFRARAANTPGSYLFDNGTNSQTEVIESYIDTGEPLEHIYEGPGVNTFDYEDGRNDGLIYLCYLGQDGFKWNTSESQSTITLETVSLSYNDSTVATACSNPATSFKSNFTTAWNDAGTWTTNGNKLYNSAGTNYAHSGYYHKDGIVRYWNYSTLAFTSRQDCPSYTSIQLAYNASATSSSLNGTFSTRTKSTYYVNSTALSAATSLYTNASGTSLATAGWYRDGGSRRYWNGTAFEGAVFTENYVNHISSVTAYGTSASNACGGQYSIYGYYENSAATSKTFSGSSGITNLYISNSIDDGTGVINYANSAYWYSDEIVSRKCTSSFTGALGTSASCSYTAPSPGGGNGGTSGGSGCVLFGTKIKMADGTIKLVQDVSVNDILYSKSVRTMPVKEGLDNLYVWSTNSIVLTDETVKVVSNRSQTVSEVYSINDGKLFTSWDHNHLFKHNGIWKVGKTVNLEAGDSLIDETGKEIIINNMVKMTGQFIVYKLDVEENDLYIANGILTHNNKEQSFQAPE